MIDAIIIGALQFVLPLLVVRVVWLYAEDWRRAKQK